MTDVKIRAKGCAATGITDELANKMYNTKGSRHLAIVEFKVERTSEDADGDRAVELTIQEVEPVVDGNLNGALDEHVRTIQQALYRNRALAEGQAELELDGPEPTVAEVLQHGKSLIATDEDGQVTGTWDGDTDEADEDLGDQPHEFVPGPDDSCLHCGGAEHEAYATTAGDAVEDWVDSQHGDEPEPEDLQEETNVHTLAFSGKTGADQ